jgi:SAM-dependent methyltransferase
MIRDPPSFTAALPLVHAAARVQHDGRVDPLAGSSWSTPQTVAGFAKSPPNARLMHVAADELKRRPGGRALDIGCGAARNAVPLARLKWRVVGTDLSWPMLAAAQRRAHDEVPDDTLHVVQAPMTALPVRTGAFDLVVAHGIWNLARSTDEFRAGVREAARVAAPGAMLFVFTFSRNTLPGDVLPVAGERFVFTQFSGQPQCFLTSTELLAELGAAGFAPDPAVPLVEHNRPKPGMLSGGAPVIYEGGFRVDYSGR